MEAVSTIIGPIVESLLVPVKKHLGYLFSSTKHVRNMSTRMKQLDATSVDVKKHMETNNISNREIPARVPGWLEEVEKIKKDAECVSSDGNGCFDMKNRYRAGKRAFMISEEIGRLIKENLEIIWSDKQEPLGKVSSKKEHTSAPVNSNGQGNDFKSREKTFNDALRFLQQDHKTRVIALCGMGGVGKTTMMEQLKKTVEEKRMFDWIAKVVIGQQVNIFSIQQAVSEYIGQPLTEKSKTARADRLRIMFEKRSQEAKNKILIVLDDVWEMIELKDIGLPNPLPNSFKLLLTSRHESICRQIAVEANSDIKVVKVNVMEESEAQKFFWGITGDPKEYDPEVNNIGGDIVRRCGFLPLAIKLIARTLKHKENFVWRNTLHRLIKNDLYDNLQEIIDISYKYLKEEEERAIFLLCGLFPEDFNIPIEDLTRYAWGLNLLKEGSTLGDARDMTKTCVHNLKDASLLIEGDLPGCVKMHDLVLVFVLGKVSKGDQPWIIKHGDISSWSEADRSETCKIISLTCLGMSEFPRNFKYPNLSLLRLMHGDKSLKFPEDFYEKMGNLEVIAYENMEYLLLPRSLECSTRLRTLCFHNCLLMFDCSPIGNLLSLEVLSFSYCGVRKLQSALGNLKKLKLLDVTGCIDLRIDDGVFKSLVKLEELYMRPEYEKSVKLTDTNLKELAECSKNLCALEIEFFEKNAQQQLKNMSFKELERFKICIGRTFNSRLVEEVHSFFNTLLLVTKKDELLECGVNELFQKTEVLSLQVEGMNDLEQVMVESITPQHSFYNLRELTLNKCSELRYVFTGPMASGLVKLERLSIKDCPVIEEVVYNEINVGGDGVIKFQKLKHLYLAKLPKLVGLCKSTSNVIELPQLVVLKLVGLPNFTSIYPENGSSTSNMSCDDIPLSQPFFNKEVVIPKLEILRISNMEKLKSIWAASCEIKSSSSNDEEEVIIRSAGGCVLRHIGVYGCASVVNLFPTNPMPLLQRLESLEVNKCSSIEVLFNIDIMGCGNNNNVGEIEEEEEGKGSRSCSLRSIQVRNSREFREVWRLKASGVIRDDVNYNISNWFQAVESIKIRWCKRFRNVFTPPTVTRFHLPALRLLVLDGAQRRGQQINDISKEERLQVDDNITNVALPFHLMTAFHHLQDLGISNLIDVEVLFEMESRGLVKTHNNQQPPALLPHLKSLYLWDMEKMDYVWKCNWSNILFTQKEIGESSFQDLTSIDVQRCKNIKYLFSPFMIKLLSSLEKITILNCDGIEEVFSNRDEKPTASTSSHPNTTSFPNLISGANSIHAHDKVEKLQKLKELEISRCRSMRVIFEIEGVNNINDGQSTPTALTIQRSSNMTFLEFPNLMILKIKKCDLLEHLFTRSTLESLKQLVELTVEECKEMKVIVKEDGEHSKTSTTVALPRLKSFKLADLPNIKGFFLGMNEFQWPLLDKVEIYGCPQMMVFTSGHSTTPQLKYINTGVGKHSLECGLNFPSTNTSSHETDEFQSSSMCSTEPDMIRLLQSPWSFSNLIEADLNENKFLSSSRIIFPSNELLKLQNLEKLLITQGYNSVVEEIFEVAEQRNDDEDDVNEKQSVVVVFPKLKEVTLKHLENLRRMWKTNGRIVMNFPNLTKVLIDYCPLLGHVFTSCMVGSLLQLQELQISYCKNMEVIIKQAVDDSSDTTTNEELVVVFPCLKSIKLVGLENLKGFCLGKEDFVWPSLDNLEIKECPQITVFTCGTSTTPELKVIETSFGLCYATEEDPTSVINARQQEGFQF